MAIVVYLQIKQANFFGESWILSGSDCGRVFVWDKWSGEVVNMLQADSHVVNCIQPHPQAYCESTGSNILIQQALFDYLCYSLGGGGTFYTDVLRV